MAASFSPPPLIVELGWMAVGMDMGGDSRSQALEPGILELTLNSVLCELCQDVKAAKPVQ